MECSIVNVIETEIQGRIDKSIALLEQCFQNKSNSAQSDIRLLFNIWYCLMEPDFDSLNLDPSTLESKLKQYYAEIPENHKSDPFFLFVLSYMISQSPWYFGDDQNNSELFARKVRFEIMQKEPSNMLFVWNYYLHEYSSIELESNFEFQRIKKHLMDHFNDYFIYPYGLMEQYFNKIVSYDL